MKLIVDFNPTGHHPNYVEIMIRSGFDGILLTSQSLWNEVSNCVKENCKATVYIPFKKMPLAKEELEKIIKLLNYNKQVTECLHLHFDYLLYSNIMFFIEKGLLFQKIPNIEGIWFGGSFFYPRKYFLIDWVKKLLVSGFIIMFLICFKNTKIYFVNEDIVKYFKNIHLISNQVEWCPDPFKRRTNEITSKYVQEESKLPTIVFMGYHLPHKGTSWALRALLKWDTPLRVFIGGSIEKSPEIKMLCEKFVYPVKVILMDWKLSEQEMYYLYSNASAVILPYIYFGGSSGIFVDSIYNGVPVLATNWGILGKRVMRLSAGKTFSAESELDFRKKLSELLYIKTNITNNSVIKKYLIQNTPEKLYETLTGNVPVNWVEKN